MREEEVHLERRVDRGRESGDVLRAAGEDHRVVDRADRHRERDGGGGMGGAAPLAVKLVPDA